MLKGVNVNVDSVSPHRFSCCSIFPVQKMKHRKKCVSSNFKAEVTVVWSPDHDIKLRCCTLEEVQNHQILTNLSTITTSFCKRREAVFG